MKSREEQKELVLFFATILGVDTNELSKDGLLILIIRSRSVICNQACMTLA